MVRRALQILQAAWSQMEVFANASQVLEFTLSSMRVHLEDSPYQQDCLNLLSCFQSLKVKMSGLANVLGTLVRCTIGSGRTSPKIASAGMVQFQHWLDKLRLSSDSPTGVNCQGAAHLNLQLKLGQCQNYKMCIDVLLLLDDEVRKQIK